MSQNENNIFVIALVNLSVLYTQTGNFKLAKNYIDIVNGSTVKFLRKKDIALIYYKLGDVSESSKSKAECYNAAAENFAKSKEWLKV